MFGRFRIINQDTNFAPVKEINILVGMSVWMYDALNFVAPSKIKGRKKKLLLKKK